MFQRSSVRAGVFAALCATFAMVAAAAPAAAVSTTVPCSGPGGGAAGLIAAVNAANAAGGGTIALAHGCTYALTARNNAADGGNGLPVVTTRIVLNGDGTTIAGNSTNFRIFDVSGGAGGGLTLNHLTLTGGNVGGPGGAIFNLEGTVTLNQTLVTGNASGAGGGGIASGTGGTGPVGVLVLNNSQVTWNTVSGEEGGGGGGILNHAGTLTLNNSEVSHNTAPGGGGIASGPGNGNTGGSSLVTLNNSRVSDNTATAGPFGGGAGLANGGVLVSHNSQVTDNTAPGGVGAGILNHATATLNNTVVSGNTAPDDSSGDSGLGGGIANANFGIPGAPSPSLVMHNGSVTGNSASGEGGGIANVGFGAPAGTVTLYNTNVNSNTPDNCFPGGSISGCTG
jgi:hypothetical protein